jgi:hypothetical protein
MAVLDSEIFASSHCLDILGAAGKWIFLYNPALFEDYG